MDEANKEVYESSLLEVKEFLKKLETFPANVKHIAVELLQKNLVSETGTTETGNKNLALNENGTELKAGNDGNGMADFNLLSGGPSTETCSNVEKEINVVIRKLRTDSEAEYKVEDANDGVSEDDSEIRYHCSLCDYKTLKKRSLEYHMIHKHEIRTYICSLCYKNFKMRSVYALHMKRHNNQRDYKCDICDFRGYTKSEVKQHCVSHAGQRSHMCQYCGKMFLKKTTLGEHVRTVHEKTEKYTCPHCDYASYRMNNLKVHMQGQHSDEETHICPVCRYQVKYRQAFLEHMMTHTGEKSFRCDQCDSSFVCAARLTVHQKSVHAPRLFMCSRCTKSFQTKHHLQRHELIHTDVKPFSCMFCCYSCNTHGNLTKHIKGVHNKQDFSFRKKKTQKADLSSSFQSKCLKKGEKLSEEYLKRLSVKLGHSITVEELRQQEITRQNQATRKMRDAKKRHLKRSEGFEHSYHSKKKIDKESESHKNVLVKIASKSKKDSIHQIVLQDGDILNVRDIETLPESEIENDGMSSEIHLSVGGTLYLLEKRRTEEKTVAVVVRKIENCIEFTDESVNNNILYVRSDNSVEVPILLTKNTDENVVETRNDNSDGVIETVDVPVMMPSDQNNFGEITDGSIGV